MKYSIYFFHKRVNIHGNICKYGLVDSFFSLTQYVRLVCFDGKGWERIHYMILKPENPFSYEWMVVMQ